MTLNDRILPVTRWVSAVIVPFLVLAFLILYITPEDSGKRFAWELRPNMQAMFIAAGYIGGAYFFVRVIFGKRWHRVALGFLPVTIFTVSMLGLTVIHWDAFDKGHFPFQLWLILYIVTPLLVPWLWLNNHSADSGEPDSDELLMPMSVRWLMGGLGVMVMITGVVGFIFPDVLIDLWVWALRPLSARALAGWLALLGSAGIVSARESRWSGWRVGLESIFIWHMLILIAAALNPDDFTDGLLNWYIVSVALLEVGMIALYIWMEMRRRALI